MEARVCSAKWQKQTISSILSYDKLNVDSFYFYNKKIIKFYLQL